VQRISGLWGHAKPGKAPTREEIEKEGFISALEGAVREVQNRAVFESESLALIDGNEG